MRKDPALKEVMKDQNRADVKLVDAALVALDRLVPSRDGQQARENLVTLQEDVARTRAETESIFDFDQLKRVVSNPNWSTETRRARDDSKNNRFA